MCQFLIHACFVESRSHACFGVRVYLCVAVMPVLMSVSPLFVVLALTGSGALAMEAAFQFFQSVCVDITSV